jgi:transcriptional regulator NrdR family protein
MAICTECGVAMHCPQCHSPRAFLYSYRPQTGAAIRRAWQCLACGHGWPYTPVLSTIDASAT